MKKKKIEIRDKVDEKIANLDKYDPFLITITSLNKEKSGLETHIFMDKFHFNDLDGTRDVIVDLIKNAKKELLK